VTSSLPEPRQDLAARPLAASCCSCRALLSLLGQGEFLAGPGDFAARGAALEKVKLI